MVRRQAFVSVQRLSDDLQALAEVSADCVTFAGLGEPTLASNLAELARAVQQRLHLPMILLTGSALLPRADVRRDLLGFDRVAVKLDAPTQDLFGQINRPVPGYPYHLPAVLDGIRLFRQAFAGQLCLQMMFVRANQACAPQMAELALTLDPDEIQLDTPLQPALGEPVSGSEMARIEQAFARVPAHVRVRSLYRDGEAQVKPRLQ
jgi:wyosine [tRNA(Phe)-imidazoG37] synthetase (radical SAM superfamily)